MNECYGVAGRIRFNTFSYEAWPYRTEVARALAYHAPGDGLHRLCDHARSIGCLALFVSNGEREDLTRACETGDPGSCLLDTLDLLEKPDADREAVYDELASQCTWGGAMACAWRLELVRMDRPADDLRSPGFDDAFRWSQKACAELHEGVACAATAKAMAQLGWDASASQMYAHACELGYEPACNGSIATPLREEREPTVLGAPIWDPNMRLLPGRVPPPNSRVNRPLVPVR